jgi:hypothetical protein
MVLESSQCLLPIPYILTHSWLLNLHTMERYTSWDRSFVIWFVICASAAVIKATVQTVFTSDLRICSSCPTYSTGIVPYRIAHLQLSSKRRTLLFFRIFVHVESRAMFPNDASYICSPQRYSTYIVSFRLAHLQQSSTLQCRHCSIPTCACAAVVKASYPLVFQSIRTHFTTRYVWWLFFVYRLLSKLQYIHCSIPTFRICSSP